MMKRITLPLLLPLAAVVLMSGCASAPNAAGAPTAVAPAGCSQLGAEIARAEEARDAAIEKQRSAWRVVVPFAVAARYASGKSAVGDADQRLAELRGESSRQGCP